MIDEPSTSHYLDALRNDLPTARDEARLRRRLTAVGLGVTATAVTHASAAAVSSFGKVSLVSAWSLRFAQLPLLSQLGLVTATTAVLATGPAVVIMTGTTTKEASVATLNVTAPRSPAFERTALREHARLTPADTTPVTSENAASVGKSLTTNPPSPLSQRARPSNTPLDEKNSSLAEETVLVDSALSAIRASRFDEAARFLRTHTERFPQGTLALERERALQKLREARLRVSR